MDYILSTAKDCPKIVSLVQVGSRAEGFHDEKSDLDFVIAYDNNESMTAVAIKRNNFFRTVGELEFVRKISSSING